MTDPNQTIPQTEFDKKTFNGSAQMLKASIDYLPPEFQKHIALLIRFLELKETMDYFSNTSYSMCSVKTSNKGSIETILSDIQKYCADSEYNQINEIIHLLNFIKMYQTFSEMNPSNPSTPLNTLKNLNITPEQFQIFQTLFQNNNDVSNFAK